MDKLLGCHAILKLLKHIWKQTIMDFKTSSKSLLQLKENRIENYEHEPSNEKFTFAFVIFIFYAMLFSSVQFEKSSTIKIETSIRIQATTLPVVVRDFIGSNDKKSSNKLSPQIWTIHFLFLCGYFASKSNDNFDFWMGARKFATNSQIQYHRWLYLRSNQHRRKKRHSPTNLTLIVRHDDRFLSLSLSFSDQLHWWVIIVWRQNICSLASSASLFIYFHCVLERFLISVWSIH